MEFENIKKEEISDLIAEIQRTWAKPSDFKPNVYFSRDGDFLEVSLTNDPYYVEWISPTIEVKRSYKNNEIVGVIINTISRFAHGPRNSIVR